MASLIATLNLSSIFLSTKNKLSDKAARSLMSILFVFSGTTSLGYSLKINPLFSKVALRILDIDSSKE